MCWYSLDILWLDVLTACQTDRGQSYASASRVIYTDPHFLE